MNASAENANNICEQIETFNLFYKENFTFTLSNPEIWETRTISPNVLSFWKCHSGDVL